MRAWTRQQILHAISQGLLQCLAPFTGVIYPRVLGQYTELLEQQPALAIKIEFNDRYEQASTYHQLGKEAHDEKRTLLFVDEFEP